MRRSLLLMACVGLCALAFSACTKDRAFSAGTEMNAEEMKLYRERLLAEKEEGEVPEAEPEEPVPLETCYYTENGTVWHADRECAYLKRSKNVLNGSVEGAAIAGKTRPCSSCAAAYIED